MSSLLTAASSPPTLTRTKTSSSRYEAAAGVRFISCILASASGLVLTEVSSRYIRSRYVWHLPHLSRPYRRFWPIVFLYHRSHQGQRVHLRSLHHLPVHPCRLPRCVLGGLR